MIYMADLYTGDRVRIVGSWAPGCYANERLMSHWLGQTMTVREVRDNYALMVEDAEEYNGDGWRWYPAAIDSIVENDSADDMDDDIDMEIDTTSLSKDIMSLI